MNGGRGCTGKRDASAVGEVYPGNRDGRLFSWLHTKKTSNYVGKNGRLTTVFELVVEEIRSRIRKFIKDEGVFDVHGKIMVLLN